MRRWAECGGEGRIANRGDDRRHRRHGCTPARRHAHDVRRSLSGIGGRCSSLSHGSGRTRCGAAPSDPILQMQLLRTSIYRPLPPLPSTRLHRFRWYLDLSGPLQRVCPGGAFARKDQAGILARSDRQSLVRIPLPCPTGGERSSWSLSGHIFPGARFILERCFDDDLVMVASPAHMSAREWAFQYVYRPRSTCALSCNQLVEATKRAG